MFSMCFHSANCVQCLVRFQLVALLGNGARKDFQNSQENIIALDTYHHLNYQEVLYHAVVQISSRVKSGPTIGVINFIITHTGTLLISFHGMAINA